MLNLALAIIFSFLNAVLIKTSESQGVSTSVVIASNYIVALTLGWGLSLWQGIDDVAASTVLLGVGSGILWPSTFYVLMWGIRRYGLSLAGSVRRLSLLVPVLFALLFLQEALKSPAFVDNSTIVYTTYSVMGVVLAFAAGILIWRERVQPANVWGVLVAVVAITLLNL